MPTRMKRLIALRVGAFLLVIPGLGLIFLGGDGRDHYVVFALGLALILAWLVLGRFARARLKAAMRERSSRSPDATEG